MSYYCVWLAWGKKCLLEAEKSRRTAAFIGYQTLLVTDQASLDQMGAVDLGFDAVTVVNFAFPAEGNLRNTEIWRWLPRDQGPLLLVDTDTQFIRNVDYGFRQAERFGLACTFAVLDTLEYFLGSGTVMRRLGVEPVGQPVYNGGVLFIDPASPLLWKVLQRREALARLLGGRSDQPSLALAIEQLELNPFILPKSFNYRGLGELICEPVRIWHSREPMPEDIAEPLGWHLRRFGSVGSEWRESSLQINRRNFGNSVND